MTTTHAPLMERFWQKVDTSGACWEWRGARNAPGYGVIAIGGGRAEGAHRVSWILTYGLIPPGEVVRHRCDNPPCVRPSHLEIGTHADNMRDMTLRGRRVDNNAAKTHCHRGHPYSGNNLYVVPSTGDRMCKECARILRAVRVICPVCGGSVGRGQRWNHLQRLHGVMNARQLAEQTGS